MVAPSPIVEAFSLSHAQILDGATPFASVTTGSSDWGDIFGVNDASLDLDSDSYDRYKEVTAPISSLAFTSEVD